MRRFLIAVVVAATMFSTTTAHADAGWAKYNGHYVRFSTVLSAPTSGSLNDWRLYLADRDRAIHQAKVANFKWHKHLMRLAALAAAASAPSSSYAPAPYVPSGPVNWDAIAMCESTGRWDLNTGNGYFGGLQENTDFWTSYGGLAYAARPDLASREAQIAVAERAYATRGLGPWPYCGQFG